MTTRLTLTKFFVAGDGDHSVFLLGSTASSQLCIWEETSLVSFQIKTMNLGSLFLKSVTSGVITKEEMDWVTNNQIDFTRIEEAAALKLGRLLDNGVINIGCRI